MLLTLVYLLNYLFVLSPISIKANRWRSLAIAEKFNQVELLGEPRRPAYGLRMLTRRRSLAIAAIRFNGDWALETKFVIPLSSSFLALYSNVVLSTRFLAGTSLWFRSFHNTACLQLRPKPKSSGLEVKAILKFQDLYFNSQSININKQGIYLQVNY